MTAKQVSVRINPDLAPSSHARLFDVIATGLDRYLRANLDFPTDSRMDAVMASTVPESTRW